MTPTDERRAKWLAALLAELDVIDELQADLRELQKKKRKEIGAHEQAADKLRRLLGGHEFEQLEVPGSELPMMRRDSDWEEGEA